MHAFHTPHLHPRTLHDDASGFVSCFGWKTSLSFPNRLVRRLTRSELPRRLAIVPFFSLASPSSLGVSTLERERECREREESEGKRIRFSFAGVVAGEVPVEPGGVTVFVDAPFVLVVRAAAGFGVAVPLVPFTAGVAPFVAGFSSDAPFAPTGVCVDGSTAGSAAAVSAGAAASAVVLPSTIVVSRGALADTSTVGSGATTAGASTGMTGVGSTAVSTVVLPSTTVVSSGLLSDTSATGTLSVSSAGSVLSGRTETGTFGATGAGSEGRTASLVISGALASGAEDSGAGVGSSAAGRGSSGAEAGSGVGSNV